MRIQSLTASRARFIPAPDPEPPPSLADLIGPVAGEHVVIIGARGIDLMCALIGRDAAEVTLLPRGQHPEPHVADLVVLTGIAVAEDVGPAIAQARRALTCAGRLVLATGPDGRGMLAAHAGRLLRLAGFSAVVTRRIGDAAILAAELPLFGSLARA